MAKLQNQIEGEMTRHRDAIRIRLDHPSMTVLERRERTVTVTLAFDTMAPGQHNLPILSC
jgi:hypothetical protein